MRNSPESSGTTKTSTEQMLGATVLLSALAVIGYTRNEVPKVLAPDEETRPSAVSRFLGKYIPLFNEMNQTQDARVDHVESGRVPSPEGAEDEFVKIEERVQMALGGAEPTDEEDLDKLLDAAIAFLGKMADHNNPTSLTARTHWLASQLCYKLGNMDDAITHARAATTLAKLNVAYDETSTLQDELESWSEQSKVLTMERSQTVMADWQNNAKQFDALTESIRQEREENGIY